MESGPFSESYRAMLSTFSLEELYLTAVQYEVKSRVGVTPRDIIGCHDLGVGTADTR